jgi:3-phenylpropionate/trans-cinnamate dioxygenase ferredoxin subunit
VLVQDGMVYVVPSTDAPNLPPCVASRLAGGPA